MKEGLDVLGTTPVGDTDESGYESDLEWPEERNDDQEESGISLIEKEEPRTTVTFKTPPGGQPQNKRIANRSKK